MEINKEYIILMLVNNRKKPHVPFCDHPRRGTRECGKCAEIRRRIKENKKYVYLYDLKWRKSEAEIAAMQAREHMERAWQEYRASELEERGLIEINLKSAVLYGVYPEGVRIELEKELVSLEAFEKRIREHD
jgi:hypothetical protein